MDSHGNRTKILRSGTNGWLYVPGDENRVGDPPMCDDELRLQWFKDIHAGRPTPNITSLCLCLCYVLCGTTQHSNDTPFDHTSPWDGNEYNAGDEASWTMSYQQIKTR